MNRDLENNADAVSANNTEKIAGLDQSKQQANKKEKPAKPRRKNNVNKPRLQANLQIRRWLAENDVETNKPLTSISREAFTMLYAYRKLMTHKMHFDVASAKVLIFFVLSMPDRFLIDLIQEFDIYQYYLITSKTHTSYHLKLYESDLTDHDRQLLNLIFSFYRPSDYDDKATIVTPNYSFILERKDCKNVKTRNIRRLEDFASRHEMRMPIEMQYTKDGHLYLRDYKNKIKFR